MIRIDYIQNSTDVLFVCLYAVEELFTIRSYGPLRSLNFEFINGLQASKAPAGIGKRKERGKECPRPTLKLKLRHLLGG